MLLTKFPSPYGAYYFSMIILYREGKVEKFPSPYGAYYFSMTRRGSGAGKQAGFRPLTGPTISQWKHTH